MEKIIQKFLTDFVYFVIVKFRAEAGNDAISLANIWTKFKTNSRKNTTANVLELDRFSNIKSKELYHGNRHVLSSTNAV